MCGNDATRVGRWNKTPKASLPAVESKFCRSRVPNSLSVYYYTVLHVDFAIMMWISVQSGAPDAVHRFGLIRFGHNDCATKFVEPRITANNHSVRILLKLICINKAAVSGAAGGYRSSSALPEPGDAPSIFRLLILCSFAFAREGGGGFVAHVRTGANHWAHGMVRRTGGTIRLVLPRPNPSLHGQGLGHRVIQAASGIAGFRSSSRSSA